MEQGGEQPTILDLTGQNLKRLPRNLVKERTGVTEIRLDKNNLQKLEFLSGFYNVLEFSASYNQLVRMYNIAPLKNLVTINLSYNKIICVEGLKDMVNLTTLNLSYNKIKEIDHLHNNLNLELLDISGNLITSISNLNQLVKLKKLYLHKNQISQLKGAEVYLPKSIENLSLADNKISDLNEISHLVGLINLKEITLKNNPCINMTGQSVGFDYRPFLVNWCLELKIIDGFVVDEIESLRGEWLYSQGKGRQFRPGEHSHLVQYLAENLPYNNEPLQSEQERKLRLILSKAQQHQSQLMSESLTSGKPSSTYHLMSRSLDSSLLQGGSKFRASPSGLSLSQSLHSQSSPNERLIKAQQDIPAPLPAASKLVPVPESLISPMIANIPDISACDQPKPSIASTSSYDSLPEISAKKLQTIITKADEIRSKRTSTERELAAICIQKSWRGYISRISSPVTHNGFHRMLMKRMSQHMTKMYERIDNFAKKLEDEHRLHVLQIQAINAVWRKQSDWQRERQDDNVAVKDVTTKCADIDNQLQQLKITVQEHIRASGQCGRPLNIEVATQTDIIAVHTPDNPPDEYSFLFNRPSSLPLSTHVSQFAENLVGDMFKDTLEEHNETEQ